MSKLFPILALIAVSRLAVTRRLAAAVTQRLREWLEQTHSRSFELRRHFFVQFFETEFVTTPGQAKLAAAGALALVLSLGVPYAQGYYHKYLALEELPDPGPYRMAFLADMLFGINFAALAGAILTTLQWTSLFPGLRDYLALAALPVRIREIFIAKFQALLAAAALLSLAIALPPALMVPFLMAGRYAGHLEREPLAIVVSASCAFLFLFLGLIAAQGALLNLLPPRAFARVSIVAQGALLIVLLCAIPVMLMTPDLAPWMNLRPGWAILVPPLWFLGLHQVLAGSVEPLAVQLAWRAMAGLGASAGAAMLAYFWSYRKHRVRVLESPGGESRGVSPWQEALAEALLTRARSLAVFAFTAKTLARSRQHRILLTGFAGAALALIGAAFAGMALRHTLSVHTGEFRQAVVDAPLALSLCALVGLRYLFRLPMELRANWIFRIHAPGHAAEMLAGVERFIFFFGAAPVAVLTLPAELRLLGAGPGLAASALCLLVSLLLMQLLLFSFEKVPFTSDYMPGRQLLVLPVLRYLAIATIYVGITGTVVAWAAQAPLRTGLIALLLIASLWKARTARLGLERVERLEFAEALEPAVRRLAIEGD